MALVHEHMTSPAIVVAPSATLDEIRALLEKQSISAVPVVANDGVVGVVSTTDILRARAHGADASVRADALMSTPVLVAPPDEPLDEAARRLVAGRVHRLVVVDGDKRPLGILSSRELLAGLQSWRVTAPVSAVMSSPVESIDIGDSIDAAIEKLAASNVHGLVVLDGRAPVGVFTHREALAAGSLPPALRARPVEEAMSYETICLDVGTPIYRAVAYALAMKVRRFLIVDHRDLVGVVSCVDLLGVLARAEK